MKEVNKELLKNAAQGLMFEMEDEELDLLLEEFDVIQKQIEILGNADDLNTYSPMTFPFPCETTFLREDVPLKSLTKEEALRNAKNKAQGQIKLPKVVM